MAQYYQKSIFCWCILQTNKWSTWYSGVYRFGINPRQSVFRPPLHSVRRHSCTTNVSGTHSRGCVTSRLGQHRSTEHPGDMLRIRESPASNPDHMS